MHIFTDHRNHVKDFSRGREHCCNPKKRNVDIWKRIWVCVDPMRAQGGDMQLVWVRSHQKASRGETYEQAANREGNDAADAVAVDSCNAHLPPKADLVRLELQRK